MLELAGEKDAAPIKLERDVVVVDVHIRRHRFRAVGALALTVTALALTVTALALTVIALALTVIALVLVENRILILFQEQPVIVTACCSGFGLGFLAFAEFLG